MLLRGFDLIQSPGLDGHDFLFLVGDDLVDFTDEAVGQLLDVGLCTGFVVFGDFLVLREAFRSRIGFAAKIADRDLGVFTEALDDLGEFTAAFLRKRRKRNADEIAVDGRVQAEIRVADCLFADLDHGLFPWLHGKGVGISYAELSNLVERGRAAVVVDLDVVEKTGAGAAGADLGEVVPEGFDGTAHLVFSLLDDVGSSHLC